MDKEYSNGEITIKWQPTKCEHAGICVGTLPKVYNPKASPWIAIENATTEELKNQISNCPSGALSYVEKKQGNSRTIKKIISSHDPYLMTNEAENHQAIADYQKGKMGSLVEKFG